MLFIPNEAYSASTQKDAMTDKTGTFETDYNTDHCDIAGA